MRVVERPRFRAAASVVFDTFDDAVAATRALAQSGLHPANCRLLDRAEARFSGTGDQPIAAHRLRVGRPPGRRPPCALALGGLRRPRRHPRRSATGRRRSGRDPTADTWRRAFFEMPYLRDGLVAFGAIAETFETAVTWDRFPGLHAAVKSAVKEALDGVGASGGFVSCRFTHVYADGPAPYYTVIAPGRPGASSSSGRRQGGRLGRHRPAGGTATHHHAVGRDHRPGYDRERPACSPTSCGPPSHPRPGRRPQPRRPLRPE